jgi:hypothetical protein
VAETPEKGGSATTSRTADGEIAPAHDLAPRPLSGLRFDRREEMVTLRARRMGFALMAASAMVMIALLFGAWLLLRSHF